ncbi:hypothetical protein BGZ46_005830, partial [Entomortierella lignicola]
MPQSNSTRHSQALFYRESDLKQDLSIATSKVSNLHHPLKNNFAAPATAAVSSVSAQYTPWTYNNPQQHYQQQHMQQSHQSQYQQEDMVQETPIEKIGNRIAQMTMEDYSKEKIVLLLT